MLTTKVRLATSNRTRLLAWTSMAALAAACGGDDPAPSDAAVPTIDATPGPADAAVGVVCTGALANYPGSLDNPSAGDDGSTLEFVGDLDASPDRLSIRVASNVAAIATVTLPDASWSVDICINDDDGSCTNALAAYSGTLEVTSVENRFRASLDRVIFVDDLTTPTCSASVSQASIDVAILGPI